MYRPRNSPPYELKKLPNDNTSREQLARDSFSTGAGSIISASRARDDVIIDVPPEVNERVSDSVNISCTNHGFVEDSESNENRSLKSAKNCGTEISTLHNGTPLSDCGTKENIFELFKTNVLHWFQTHSANIKRGFKSIFLLLYNIYLGFAIYLTWHEDPSYCNGIKLLSILTALVYICILYKIGFKPFLLRPFLRTLSPIATRLTHLKHFTKVIWTLVWTAVVAFLVVDSKNNRYRLVSASGLVVLLFAGFICSAYPRKIVWRHVQWGVFLQFVGSLIILRWSGGREFFLCLGDKITILLSYADQGSTFVFGYLVSGQMENIPEQAAVFAFKVLPVVVFFSFLVSILYYYGIMQALVINVGWLLQQTVGTTACESMNAAGNIFLGMTEAPLVIAPYLQVMTKSELHAVLTGGFATIAGSVMVAYINFGISASHLLSASVMSAPAALAFSKLVYPETEKSVTNVGDIQLAKGKETNALEAASNGASTAIALVANIAVNLVAFVAFIAMMDGILTWFGSLVHWEFISFEWLLSKIFVPLSLVMGVEWEDSEKVAQLVGLKTMVNEFVAYRKLGEFQKENALSPRSEAIATFALCGFSNVGSIGIQLGFLGSLAPERKPDLAKLAVRAMIAGSAACFMTACVAGTLLTDFD